MILEELSVRFQADVAPALTGISTLMQAMTGLTGQLSGLEGDFSAAGAQAGEGLARGLLSRHGRVENAARQVARAAAAALQNALQIHSPSRLTEEMGLQLDAGLIGGLRAGANRVERAAADTAHRAQSGLDGGLTGAADAADAASLLASQLPTVKSAAPAVPAAAHAGGGEAAVPVNLTVPLMVDGYQLGVAAIEGINRVSRGTGRVDLTL